MKVRTYLRQCKRCGELFNANSKFCRICENCKKPNRGEVMKGGRKRWDLRRNFKEKSKEMQ